MLAALVTSMGSVRQGLLAIADARDELTLSGALGFSFGVERE